MAGQPQKLEIDDGEGYRNIGGSLQQGGAANCNKKILSLVAGALVLMGALSAVLYFALRTTDTATGTQQAQLKITHKVTLTIGDQRGNKLGEIVIGVFGEHVPVAAYNFVALADHKLDKAPGSHVVGFGYRGSSFSRVIEQSWDPYVEGGDKIQGHPGGLAVYDAERWNRRFWARDQGNPNLVWENGTSFAKDNLTECCTRESWVAMKDISSTEGDNPAYSSIFKIFTVDDYYHDYNKDLVLGKVMEEKGGMEVVKKITLKHLVKNSKSEKLSTPIMLDKPGKITVPNK